MCLNYIASRMSNFNIVLSVISIISEIALLFIGFFIVWNAKHIIHSITSLGAVGGVSGRTRLGITVAMVSFIGLESISQPRRRRSDRTLRYRRRRLH